MAIHREQRRGFGKAGTMRSLCELLDGYLATRWARVTDTKFGKSRLDPLHAIMMTAIRKYQVIG